MKHLSNIKEIHPTSVRAGLEELVGHSHLLQDNGPQKLNIVDCFHYGAYHGCTISLSYSAMSEYFCQLSIEGPDKCVKVVLGKLMQIYKSILKRDKYALEWPQMGLK